MLWLIVLGISNGMRTMTALAVLCWFAYLGLLPQTGGFAWAGYLVSAIVFTVFAIGEYIGDTLPKTPARTSAVPLIARIVFASVAGAMVNHATMNPIAGGVVFAAVGALIGAFGGMRLRLWAAKLVGRDLPVALLESALALALALFVAYKFHGYYVVEKAFS